MRRSDGFRSLFQTAVIASALCACNPAPAGTDAGHTGVDGGGGDGGGTVLPTLPAAVANGAAAMLGCQGTATMPTPGAEISINMNLESFGQNGDHAAMTRMCFCEGNELTMEALAVPGTACGTGCQDVTTDASGQAMVTAHANGWYAYRIFAHMGPTHATQFLDSIQVNEPAPAAAGGTVTGNAVSRLTADLISEAELVTRQPGTTTIAGRIGDCMDENMSNAIVRSFHSDGTEIVEGDDVTQAHYRYFDGAENPDASAMFTGSDGLYVIVNAHPATTGELIRVEAWAYTGSGTGTPTRIGCEAVHALPDGVSIVNIGPLRSDYAPIGGMPHPCAAH
jgi:hypothetical protein